MLSDIDTKTFDFGMLRALGYNKMNIASTMFIQSTLIAVLAVIAGVAFAAALNAGMRRGLFELTSIFTDFWLTKTAL